MSSNGNCCLQKWKISTDRKKHERTALVFSIVLFLLKARKSRQGLNSDTYSIFISTFMLYLLAGKVYSINRGGSKFFPSDSVFVIQEEPNKQSHHVLQCDVYIQLQNCSTMTDRSYGYLRSWSGIGEIGLGMVVLDVFKVSEVVGNSSNSSSSSSTSTTLGPLILRLS